MNKLTLLACLVGAFLITACDKTEPTQTVEWYKEHDAERNEKIKQCKNNPGELASTPNCINAQKAESLYESLKRDVLDVVPVDDIFNSKGQDQGQKP